MKPSYTYLFLTLMLVSCNTDRYPSVDEPSAMLSISSVGMETAKSVQEGGSFSNSETCSIGLFLESATGDVYPGGPYDNVEFVKACGSQNWTGVKSVALDSSSGTLYAYYPYDDSSSDMTSVPVQSSLDGKDYMYAVPVTGVNSSNSEVNLHLKHALALINLNLAKVDGYPGDCELTSVSLEGDGIAASGTLNLADGCISAVASTFNVSGIKHSFSNGLCEKLLVVPALVSSERQTVKVSFIVDGDSKELTFSSSKGLIVKQGVRFSVNITVSGSGLNASNVSITDWNGNEIVEAGLAADGIVITGGESGQYGGQIDF